MSTPTAEEQPKDETTGETVSDSTSKGNEQSEKVEDSQGQPKEDYKAAGNTIQEMEIAEEAKSSDTSDVYDLEPSNDSAFRMGTEEQVDPAIIKQLVNGFVEQILPSLGKSKSSIDEILSNQTVLIETMDQENSKFRECTPFRELTETMGKARDYHNKLLALKRDMVNLHDRAAKLKKRALKLQQQKQREELQNAHQQERELEKEQMLTARVARPDA